MDRQGLMQAIFNGLLFLLKDSSNAGGTLIIETKAESPDMGQNWFQVDVGWKSDRPVSNLTLVSVESWDFNDSLENVHDPSMTQGVIFATQIIQRHAGNFRLLTSKNAILGFQIQLPLSIPYDHKHLVGSFPLSSSPSEQIKSSSDPETLFS